MANVMSMKTIMNKPSRNGFDLSFKKNFTAKCGELLPVMCKEVLPGDVFKINLKAMTRTQPINTAAFARVREYYDFFFVPYHLLWNRANEVLSLMNYNLQHATSISGLDSPFNGEMPYLTTEQIINYLATMHSSTANKNYFGYKRDELSVKLLEYLGYGNFDGALAEPTEQMQYNLDTNIMGLLAYQKIYSDFFRDQQWERPNPSTFNVDYMNGASAMNVNLPTSDSDPFFLNYNMFDMRYCNWPKDMYHGLLPAAQYGETSVVPIDLTGTVIAGATASGSNPLTIGFQDAPVKGVNNLTSIVAKLKSADASRNIVDNGFSILALRQAEFLQKWKEIVQCGDQDYKGVTKRIWNVDVPNGLADKSQYLGGITSSLSINEVVNTNITADNAADIAGKGFGTSDGVLNFKSDGQFGLLMCIYHAMPLVDYTVNYVDPMFTRVNAEDFANPVFDRVGMQQVMSTNLLQRIKVTTDVPDNNGAISLGFAPRYVDYKTSIDLSVGAFKRDLSHWVVSYGVDDVLAALRSKDPNASGELPSPEPPDISNNYTFFKINPNILDSIFSFAVDSSMSTDQFLCSSFFDIKAVRNMDVDGLPY